jgi:hypothetical protein
MTAPRLACEVLSHLGISTSERCGPEIASDCTFMSMVLILMLHVVRINIVHIIIITMLTFPFLFLFSGGCACRVKCSAIDLVFDHRLQSGSISIQ